MRAAVLVGWVLGVAAQHAADTTVGSVQGGEFLPGQKSWNVDNSTTGGFKEPTWNTTYPTWNGTDPTWNNTYPMWNETYPTWNETYPAWNNTYPTWNETYPTWNETYPTWNETYPTWNNTYPMWNETYPTWNTTYPTWNNTYPTWNETYPTWNETYPTWNETYPTWNGTYPTWNNTYPTWNETYPTWNETYPTWNNTYPTWNETYPTWNGTYPTWNETYPTWNTTYPTWNNTYPTWNETYPTWNTTYPTWNNTYPTWNETYPTWNGTYPTWNNTYPTWNETYPTWNNTYPTWNETYPTWNGTYPTWNNTYPTWNETYPTWNNTYPTWNNTYPTWNETYPTWNNTYPTWNNTYPTWNNTYPTWNNTYPTWNETYPTWNGTFPREQNASRNTTVPADLEMCIVTEQGGLLASDTQFGADCCRMFDIGCPAPFSCFGTSGWTASQESWCCRARDAGCLHTCNGAADAMGAEEAAYCCDRKGVACAAAWHEEQARVDEERDLAEAAAGVERQEVRLQVLGLVSELAANPKKVLRRLRWALLAASLLLQEDPESLVVTALGAVANTTRVSVPYAWNAELLAEERVGVQQWLNPAGRGASVLGAAGQQQQQQHDPLYIDYTVTGKSKAKVAQAVQQIDAQVETGSLGGKAGPEVHTLPKAGPASGSTPSSSSSSSDKGWVWALAGVLGALCVGTGIAAVVVHQRRTRRDIHTADVLCEVEGKEMCEEHMYALSPSSKAGPGQL